MDIGTQHQSGAQSSSIWSTSSSASDHWLVRLRESSQRDSLGSAGSLGAPPGPLPPADSPELPVFREESSRPAETSPAPEPSTPQGFRGPRVRSLSMRSPTRTREALSKVLPLRWSLGARERSRPPQTPAQTPVPLVEYLESGRRPRCSREPIAALVATPPLAVRGVASEGGWGEPGCGPGGGAGGGSPSPRRPEGQSRAGGSERTPKIPEEPGRAADPQLRGAILGGHVSHSAPPSRDSTLRRSRAHMGPAGPPLQTGPPGPPLQRDLLHAALDRKQRSQEILMSPLRPPSMRRDAPRGGPPPTAVESLIRASGPPGRAPGGPLTQLSLSNGTLNGGEEARGGTQARGTTQTHRHHGDNPAADITRALSSSSLPGGPDQSLRRCTSLQRSGELGLHPLQPLHPLQHHPLQHQPLHPLQHHPLQHHQHLLRRLAEKPGCEPLPRTQYSTTSLGRQGPGLGVRF
ncbi:unnamed protein product [Boreogadus saida]